MGDKWTKKNVLKWVIYEYEKMGVKIIGGTYAKMGDTVLGRMCQNE